MPRQMPEHRHAGGGALAQHLVEPERRAAARIASRERADAGHDDPVRRADLVVVGA